MPIESCHRVRCDFCRTNAGPPRLSRADAIEAARESVSWVRRIFVDHSTGFEAYSCRTCLIDSPEAREMVARGKAAGSRIS